jgi:hypothetical protein
MKITFIVAALITTHSALQAQDLKPTQIPAAVKRALEKRYPQSSHVSWEKEKGNYEANWGGKSGEDNSVQFTPSAEFIEIVKAIPVNQLPKGVTNYIREHYKNVEITEAGRVTNAKDETFYEAEVHGKDLLFSKEGAFISKEN